MKKYAAIFLFFIYTLSVIGLAVNKFYCCGKLKSVSVVANPAHIKAETENKKTGCCKNEKTTFQVKDSHVSSAKLTVDAKFYPIIPATFLSVVLPNLFSEHNEVAFYIKGPPNSPDTPSYILNCTYRI